MGNKLEQLLNSLIEKGWKPFGEGCHRSPYKKVHIHKNYNKERTYALFYSNNHTHWKVLRQLVSKESGLWQFVCENDYWVHKDTYFVEKYTDHTAIHLYQCNDYHYWLLGSALCDEDKLEEFLLSNIKVND